MKIIGALLIIAGTTYYGFFLCFRQKSRICRLKAFKQTLLLLNGQIRFGCTSIPQAFADIADKCTYADIREFYAYAAEQLKANCCEDFSQVWNKSIALYLQEYYLTREDCQIIAGIGQMPLYLDKEMQMRILEGAVLELEQSIGTAEKNLDEKCRIYKCTGFAAGVILVLVLI